MAANHSSAQQLTTAMRIAIYLAITGTVLFIVTPIAGFMAILVLFGDEPGSGAFSLLLIPIYALLLVMTVINLIVTLIYRANYKQPGRGRRLSTIALVSSLIVIALPIPLTVLGYILSAASN